MTEQSNERQAPDEQYRVDQASETTDQPEPSDAFVQEEQSSQPAQEDRPTDPDTSGTEGENPLTGDSEPPAVEVNVDVTPDANDTGSDSSES